MAEQRESLERKVGDSAEDNAKKAEVLTRDVWDLKDEAEERDREAEKKYIRATLHFDRNEIDDALMMLRAALALSPGNPKYHYNIGFLYWKQGQLEVALNHYKLFLRYAPSNEKDIPTIKARVKYIDGELKKKMRR